MPDLASAAVANSTLGVLIFVLGGLAGAVFYLPLKNVRGWAWESYWIVYAVFGLVVVPWCLACATSPNVLSVLAAAPLKTLAYCFACGALWGVGGLTWGLMIRYLGVGLGLALGCGLCSAAGTLIPPILAGQMESLYDTPAAQTSLLGVAVSLLGIVLVGVAGISKEQELPAAEKRKAVAEYNFKLGVLVALFSGLTSSGMSFGLQGGAAIESLAASTAPATSLAWRGIPVLVVVLAGGFVVNFVWCLILNGKNGTFKDYTNGKSPLAMNVVWGALAGGIWCSQFICFKTGEPQMGKQAYVGWAVLMASAIFFSTVLGIVLGEWKGTSGRTRGLLAVGLALLIGSSAITGYGGYLKAKSPAAPATGAPLAPKTAL